VRISETLMKSERPVSIRVGHSASITAGTGVFVGVGVASGDPTADVPSGTWVAVGVLEVGVAVGLPGVTGIVGNGVSVGDLVGEGPGDGLGVRVGRRVGMGRVEVGSSGVLKGAGVSVGELVRVGRGDRLGVLTIVGVQVVGSTHVGVSVGVSTAVGVQVGGSSQVGVGVGRITMTVGGTAAKGKGKPGIKYAA
jgi:hypothetical protein